MKMITMLFHTDNINYDNHMKLKDITNNQFLPITKVIRQLSEQMDTKMPQVMLLDSNLIGSRTDYNPTIFPTPLYPNLSPIKVTITTGALNKLSKLEWIAMLGHEMSHVKMFSDGSYKKMNSYTQEALADCIGAEYTSIQAMINVLRYYCVHNLFSKKDAQKDHSHPADIVRIQNLKNLEKELQQKKLQYEKSQIEAIIKSDVIQKQHKYNKSKQKVINSFKRSLIKKYANRNRE